MTSRLDNVAPDGDSLVTIIDDLVARLREHADKPDAVLTCNDLLQLVGHKAYVLALLLFALLNLLPAPPGYNFVMALIKASVFGLTATLVATFKGLHTKGGPSGVADSVNEAVVLAFALVFILNTIMSALYTVVVPAVGSYR